MAQAMFDLLGRRFGRLVVVGGPKRSYWRNKTVLRWFCKCDCGEWLWKRRSDLTRGKDKSCGCWRREIKTTHGHARRSGLSPTYNTWVGMVQRCTDPNHVGYRYYMGRGIRVCKSWLTFENFLADMGEKPKGLTLDRIDNDGDYEPSNCRWATWSEQRANQRKPQSKLLMSKSSP